MATDERSNQLRAPPPRRREPANLVEEIEPDALQELLDRELGPETKDTVMTVAERYIEQGRQALLLRQLRRRFGEAVDPDIEARIGKATGAEIETWSDQVLSAATLDEVFAG